MIKKTRIYAILGIALFVNAIICVAAFVATFREKKKTSAMFWALAVALGVAGASFMAIYSARENLRLRDLRRAIAEKDHWFHSFEYPECVEPDVDIEEEYFAPVETEDEEESED